MPDIKAIADEADVMYLVFDVGGTFIKYAVMTEDGTICEKKKIPTPAGVDNTLDDFTEAVYGVYCLCSKNYQIDGIAIGMPGQVDVEKGIVYCGGAIKYMDDIPLGKIISEKCGGIRVSVENDGKCAALAEVFSGNASDVQNAIVIVFGTGIGGGIIKDRKIHRGNHLLAGELSFSFVDMTRGDLEKIDKIPSLEKMSVERSFEEAPFTWSCRDSTLALVRRVAKAKGLPDSEVNGELIYKWIDEGDTVTESIVEDTYFSIAKQCCNLYVAFDPDVILIGGGISAQPAFTEGIKRYAERLSKITKVYRNMRIDVCLHRNDANLIGALCNFIQMYGK